MAETCPFFSYTGGERAERPSHTSQRSAAPAVAAKMVAGAMAATGVTGSMSARQLARSHCRSSSAAVAPSSSSGAVATSRAVSREPLAAGAASALRWRPDAPSGGTPVSAFVRPPLAERSPARAKRRLSRPYGARGDLPLRRQLGLHAQRRLRAIPKRAKHGRESAP